MGLELVLDERAAVGKSALADRAVEGQRGGGALPAVSLKMLDSGELSAASTAMCIPRSLEKI